MFPKFHSVFVLVVTLQLARQGHNRGQKDWSRTVAISPQRVGTGTRTRRLNLEVVERATVLSTVRSNWMRCEESSDGLPSD